MNGWNGLPLGGSMMGAMGTGLLPAIPSPMAAGVETLTATPQSQPLSPLSRAPNLTWTNPNPNGVNPGMFGIEGLGMNIDTLKLGLGGLQSIAGIWSANEQNKLAKKAFNLNEGILNTNLANSIRAYNMSVDDRLRSRQIVEGTSDAAREEARRRWEARDERKG